ncbi:MAG: site-specific DNA-methyltransferase [Nitrospirae bacterium]|nr:site-specific DNA-methyltransferase [Nitrospirota bacterium]
MSHLSENANPLKVKNIKDRLTNCMPNSANVEFIILPYFKTIEEIPNKEDFHKDLYDFFNQANPNSTIAILCSPIFASDFCSLLNNNRAQLKLWIAVKLETPFLKKEGLVQRHAALLIFTRYKESLRHTKTRIAYTYCPFCHKTTKDYGGKKHLYHEFGTLMSDVWRDITVNFSSYPYDIVRRLQDLFGLLEYESVNIYDQRNYYRPVLRPAINYRRYSNIENQYPNHSVLINGDCFEELDKLPDNTIDFCFADPPYNLNKKYESWNDGIDIQTYFEWCDKWLNSLARILKPGRTLAVLNIPQWCIRHFRHLITIMDYQDWIVWEGLSMPVRMIMPAHYSILCFSKGRPRPLPGLAHQNHALLEKKAIETLSENYCIRSACMKMRKRLKHKDTEITSNLWWDIHRLKHNSRRVDHPCQLPPNFMYRLIALFTRENEIVLDPFNGVGTTTLTAHELNRRYIGIELSEYYYKLASERHREMEFGLDPFRKNGDAPKAKNSPVERLKKQKYQVSKKVLQLEVKNISKQLGRIPTRDEVAKFSKFPIN